MIKVSRRYAFEAAHYLPNVRSGHKCARMHGHNYEIIVEVGGVMREPEGWVIDFWELDKIVDPIIAQVDHQTLNDILGLENPTAENIAKWFFDEINEKLGNPCRVRRVHVFETKNAIATYSRN